jgi:hypothetical protein
VLFNFSFLFCFLSQAKHYSIRLQGPYTQFIGRGTAAVCPFVCAAGAYTVNRTSCAPCVNGTFTAVAGATVCTNCSGTWSRLAATACTACSALQITAVGGGVGMLDYPYLAKAGWGVTAVVCVP